MKATIDLPDDLYRRVKAKSALQGRAIRDVTAELYRQWLDEPAPAPSDPSAILRQLHHAGGGLSSEEARAYLKEVRQDRRQWRKA